MSTTRTLAAAFFMVSCTRVVEVPKPVPCPECAACALRMDAGKADAEEEPQWLCSDPTAPCKNVRSVFLYDFKPHDMAFEPAPGIATRETVDSVPFWAIVLDTRRAVADDSPPFGDPNWGNAKTPCRGYFEEKERLAAQALFPRNKVFASRVGCQPAWIFYDGVAEGMNLVAVFAGFDGSQTAELLASAKAKYPRASAVRMRVRHNTYH
jgi:hypothetical protein